MNARALIEAEDPKHFLRHIAPPKEALIICPVQGDEQQYWSEQDQAYYRFSAALVAPQDMGKIPEYFEIAQRDEEKVVYDAADLYITELLQLLHDKQVHVIEAYEIWPTQTMLNPYPLGEAEDPKSVLRRFSSNKIWPSENYYLNLWKEGSRWQDGEFCPGQVNNENEFMQFDGMYGLVDAVYQAIGLHGDNPSPEQEEQFEKAMEVYDTAFYDSIKKGITSGTVDGVAGRYHWQLVYDASRDKKDYDEIDRPQFNDWTSQLQPVRPGQQYGTKITPKTDRSQWRAFGGNIDPNDPNLPEAVAQAVLDGEDPKKVFKRMRGPEPIFRVSISVWNRARKKTATLGKFDINAETGKVSNEKFSPQLKRPPTAEDYADILASLRKWGEGMAGHYPKGSPYPGDYHWQAEFIGSLDRYRPMLVVEGPGWTIRAPLMKSTEHYDYIWRFNKLTPEQHKVMKHFGEFIHYAMNEGPDFRGELDNEDTWDIDDFDDPGEPPFTGPVHIKWYVLGDPELAPEGSWSGTDWSGLSKGMP